MAAANTDKLRKLSRRWVGQIGSGGVADDTSTTIPLASTTNLATDTAVTLVIDRVDSAGTATPSLEETIVGVVSGTNIINAIRGVEGTAQAHNAGAVVEVLVTADGYNDIIDHLLVGHLQSGAHASGLVFQNPTLSNPTLSGIVAGNFTASGNITFTGTVTGAGAATWTSFSGAYASGTTITVSGVDVTGVMKKGVILKWLSSADAFKTGMVISSSFSTNTTITIVGSTVASGDKTFYYGPFANKETFIIPGTLAAATDIAKTFYAPEAIYPISCDARVKASGTTNATEFDINDDGTTLFNGTAASIASTSTSDLDNAAYTPTTAIAINSAITVDLNSVSTTAPVEAYLDFFYYPVSLVSRT